MIRFRELSMCIVSIFSDEKGNFVLTHNRDETHLRPTSKRVETREIHDQEFTGPVDLVSGGTWIYYSEKYIACILNGAYIKHSHLPPYRMSRGLVMLELLRYDSIDEFIQEIDLNEIEPFTMIMIDRFSLEKKILVWDGLKKYKENVSDEKLIVRSSSTLYTEEEKQRHVKYFLNLDTVFPDEAFKLHDKLKMLENNKFPTVMTTSITQIIKNENQIHLKFCPVLAS